MVCHISENIFQIKKLRNLDRSNVLPITFDIGDILPILQVYSKHEKSIMTLLKITPLIFHSKFVIHKNSGKNR